MVAGRAGVAIYSELGAKDIKSVGAMDCEHLE